MNRAEAIEAIVKDTDISKKDVTAILASQDRVIASTLKAGGEFQLGDTGKLKLQHRAEREGRNPSTGETVPIAAKNTAKFKPAKKLVDSLN